MINNVLDASAVLAVLNAERGTAKVIPLLAESAISTVNLAEVSAKLLDAGMTESIAQAAISFLGIAEVVNFDESLSWEVAKLRPLTKSFGLSLGDRACIALAMKLGVRAVTADRVWANLRFCRVLLIR